MPAQPSAVRRGAGRSAWPIVALLLLPARFSLAASETVQPKTERGAKVTNQEPFEPYRKKIALVVGIDRYSKGIQPLGYAVADARSVGHLLATEYGFEVRVLEDAQATREALINTIIGLQEETSQDDQLLFFFAGHGVSFGDGDQEVGYILPYDAAGSAQRNAWLSGIPMSELVGHLAKLPPKHLLILLDTCFSGFAAVRPRGSPTGDSERLLRRLTSQSGRHLISAGKRGEHAYERSDWRHSAFVMELLQALGEDRADHNRDGLVTVSELYSDLLSAVPRRSHGAQTPHLAALDDGQGEFVFIFREEKSEVAAELREAHLPAPPAQEAQDTRDDSANSKKIEPKTPQPRVELTEVSGSKSFIDITFAWNDMVSEASGMASVGWGEKLLLTRDPSGNLGQISWLEIPLRLLRETSVREIRLTGKPLVIKSQNSDLDLTFYPALLLSPSGQAEAGYYWNAVRIEGNCTLKSGMTTRCRFPAAKVKSLVFLQAEETLSFPPRHPDPPVAADHTELEIVTLDGTSILLSSPFIAYPGGSFGPSRETEGIAVRRGVAESTLMWSGLRILRFRVRQESNDKGTTVWRYSVEATLADGKVVDVELRDDWNMRGGGPGLLFGRTDLGEVRVPLSTISMLKVLKYTRPTKK